MALKYKIGDRVRIKDIDWYNENKDEYGDINCPPCMFVWVMCQYCGKILTINSVDDFDKKYKMTEDDGRFNWTDEMIECKVEEENKSELVPYFEVGTNKILYYKNKNTFECYFPMRTPEYICPEGYIFKDENGNEILTNKIILEKKKKEYPKTYEECCKVLGVNPDNFLSIRNLYRDDGDEESTDYERDLLGKFDSLWELRICRDAYWKIAGEKMGLGKPWEPDYSEESYEQGSPIKYVIYYTGNNITKGRMCTPSYILSFPTEEMRDDFYEAFREEIEICKELL